MRTSDSHPASNAPPSGWKAYAAILPAGTLAGMIATNNWCFVVVPIAAAVLVADLTVRRFRPSMALRLPVAVAVGVAIGFLLSVDRAVAFRDAFGIDPPRGVRMSHVRRHYLGGPGEEVVIMELTADPPGLAALTSLPTARTQTESLADWRTLGGSWEDAFEVFVGPGATDVAWRSWLRVRPILNPDVYDFGTAGRGCALFCDPSTGRCVALFAVR